MKLFASDYDGTLRVSSTVDLKNIVMINEWRKQGDLFAIVTGRSMESITNEINLNKIEVDYIVANNGGVIYDRDMKKLKETFIDFEVALKIIDYVKTVDCYSYVINDGYHRSRSIVHENEKDLKYAKLQVVISEQDLLANKKVAQVVISLSGDTKSKQIAKYLNEQFKNDIHAYVNVDCIDIVPFGVSKAEGISFIQKVHELKTNDIFTIGDSYNDLPMIDAYQGFTMEHAVDEIKTHSDLSFCQVSDCIAYLLK